jgi:hypothetical protein
MLLIAASSPVWLWDHFRAAVELGCADKALEVLRGLTGRKSLRVIGFEALRMMDGAETGVQSALMDDEADEVDRVV